MCSGTKMGPTSAIFGRSASPIRVQLTFPCTSTCAPEQNAKLISPRWWDHGPGHEVMCASQGSVSSALSYSASGRAVSALRSGLTHQPLKRIVRSGAWVSWARRIAARGMLVIYMDAALPVARPVKPTSPFLKVDARCAASISSTVQFICLPPDRRGAPRLSIQGTAARRRYRRRMY